MTIEQAYERLELPNGSDLQTIRKQFSQMHNDYRMQIDNAFNPTSKRIFEQQLEELKEAYALLNESEGMDDNASLPRIAESIELSNSVSQKDEVQEAKIDLKEAMFLFGLSAADDINYIQNECIKHINKLQRLALEAEISDVKKIYIEEIKKAEIARKIIDLWLESHEKKSELIVNTLLPEKKTNSNKKIGLRVFMLTLLIIVVAGIVVWKIQDNEPSTMQIPVANPDSTIVRKDSTPTSNIIKSKDSVVITSNSNTPTANKYDYMSDFENGIAWVEVKGKWGIMNAKRQIIVPIKYDEIGGLDEGYFKVKVGNKYGFVNLKGEEVIPLIYDGTAYFGGFSEGVVGIKLNEKYGFVDNRGNVVVPIIWDGVSYFNEGLAVVKKGNKEGFVDKTGKLVIDTRFDEVGFYGFKDGLVKVRSDGKWGVIDKTGTYVISPLYNHIWDFEDGIAKVKIDKKIFYINKKGECVKDCDN